MIAKNPRLPSWVPGGHPLNPLGNRAMYLGSSLYRIHGSNEPWTIGTNVSSGCIRLTNEDVADLFGRVLVSYPAWAGWLLLGLAASAALALFGPSAGRPFWAGVAAAEAAALLLAGGLYLLSERLARSAARLPGVLAIPAFLFALNFAFLVASWRYATGSYSGSWRRTAR